MGDDTICCICLEASRPIQRLGCGCKVAWFHPNCCEQWLSYTSEPYACPTCRRPIPMKTNYCFSYQAGIPQQHLWHSLAIFGIELSACAAATVSGTPVVWIFPVQSASILLCPFVLYSNQIYTYFLFHSTFMIFVKGICICLCSGVDSLLPVYLLLRMISYIHISIIYLLHFIQHQNRFYGYRHVDTLEPYAISRDLKLVELITEAPTDALEGDELTLSSGRRRRRNHRR